MTHYQTLGVEESATAQEIRTAYRRQLRQAHPDRGGSQEDAQRINSAYQALGTPEARAAYDRRLEMQRRGINVDGPHMAQPRQSTGTGTIPPEMWDLLTEVLIAQARAHAEARARAEARAGRPGTTDGIGAPGGFGAPGGPRIVFGGSPFGTGAPFQPMGTQPRDRSPRRLTPREVWLGGSSATRLRAVLFLFAMVGLGTVTVLAAPAVSNAILSTAFLAVATWFGLSGANRSVNNCLPNLRSVLFVLYLGLSGLFGFIFLLFGGYSDALALGFANLGFIALAAQTYVSFTFSRLREVLRARIAGDD